MLSAVISMGNLQEGREYLTIFLIFESERFPTNLRTLSFETTVHRFLRRSRTPCSFVYRSIKCLIDSVESLMSFSLKLNSLHISGSKYSFAILIFPGF